MSSSGMVVQGKNNKSVGGGVPALLYWSVGDKVLERADYSPC
jgi:hypothetical protein